MKCLLLSGGSSGVFTTVEMRFPHPTVDLPVRANFSKLFTEWDVTEGHHWPETVRFRRVGFGTNPDIAIYQIAETQRAHTVDAEVARLRAALEEIVACDNENTRMTIEVAIARAALEEVKE